MVLNLQRVSLPAIGADFRLRLDLSQLSPQGGDVHPDQFAARVFLAPDAPGDFLRGDPPPPPAHEQLDDLIFAVAQVHAAGGCLKFKCLRVQRHVAPRQRLRSGRMKSSAPALSAATPSRLSPRAASSSSGVVTPASRSPPIHSGGFSQNYSPPEGGRIALSSNERIAESLDFAIQAKFAYANKLNAPHKGERRQWIKLTGYEAG